MIGQCGESYVRNDLFKATVSDPAAIRWQTTWEMMIE